MFGIGLPELIFIFIVGLIVFGPEKLPDIAKEIAKFIFNLKQGVYEFKKNIEEEINLPNPSKEIEERLNEIYNMYNYDNTNNATKADEIKCEESKIKDNLAKS